MYEMRPTDKVDMQGNKDAAELWVGRWLTSAPPLAPSPLCIFEPWDSSMSILSASGTIPCFSAVANSSTNKYGGERGTVYLRK